MRIKNPTIIAVPYFRYVVYLLLVLVLIYHPGIKRLFAESDNGFDLQDSLVPRSEIYHGGPVRDGIPSIDRPVFIPRESVDFLHADDRVLGLRYLNVIKAYPIRILEWHEIVNDSFGPEPVVVTYCPLCGSGMAFSAHVAGATRQFGVSGLLYNNDLLLYDRDSMSLWSQILGRAISGPLRKTELKPIPLEVTTWRDWSQRYPRTQVLSMDTGYVRDYAKSPYGGYATSWDIYFPLKHRDTRYQPKEYVLGVALHGEYKAYPFIELSKTQGVSQINDEFAGQHITIHFDRINRTARAEMDGKLLPTITSYWFAWLAFHPDTEVYKANR